MCWTKGLVLYSRVPRGSEPSSRAGDALTGHDRRQAHSLRSRRYGDDAARLCRAKLVHRRLNWCLALAAWQSGIGAMQARPARLRQVAKEPRGSSPASVGPAPEGRERS